MLSKSERKMAEKSLQEERTAIVAYTDRKARTKSHKLRKAFGHALGEERTHARDFAAALKK